MARHGHFGIVASLALLCSALPTGASAQDDFGLPSDLQGFWNRYYDAKQEDDEEKMDAAVRRQRREAEDVLNLFLEALSRDEDYTKQSEARTLAWAMDRVDRGERYIERVRLVLGMEMSERKQRSAGHAYFAKAQGLKKLAEENPTDKAWAETATAFSEALERLQAVGDYEYAVYTLSEMERIAFRRELRTERMLLLEQLVETAAKLPYSEPMAESAASDLANLRELAAQAEKEGEDEGKPISGGDSLTSYAEGAEEETFSLSPRLGKKGITTPALPSFYPPEQYQLWPWMVIRGEGPVDFDTHRVSVLQPHSRRWQLRRPGAAEFAITSTGGSEPDVAFALGASPQRIDVPSPDGDEVYPLMLAARSDQEQMFGVTINMAPTADDAVLRFHLAEWWEGKVLGSTWKLYDTNFTGRYLDWIEYLDDLRTYYTEEIPHGFVEVDSVVIGKAKKAVPLSTVMPIGDDFYLTSVDSKERTVTTRKLDLKTGSVLLEYDLDTPPTHVVVREIDKLKGSFFDIVPARKGKPVVLPIGRYELCLGRLASGKRTSMDQARIYRGTSQPFTVYAGETHTIRIGAPFEFKFEARQEADELVTDTFTLRVFGQMGEEYALLFDEPLQPTIEVRTPEGKRVLQPEKLHQAGVAEYTTSPRPNDVLWFPAEHRMPNPSGEKLVVELTQKSHKLLGGPFQGTATN